MTCARFVSLISLGIFLLAVTALAAPPTLMNFQGILTDGSGSPLPSVSKSVDFTIYDGPGSGANAVWGPETRTVNTDANGRFSIILGQLSPITESVFSGSERYLGIKVEADSEIVPRARITTAGYAHRISTVDGATGGTITGDVTLQSGLLADRVWLGTSVQDGEILIENGDGAIGIHLTGLLGEGGYGSMHDEEGNYTIEMGPWDGSGEGVIYVYGDEYGSSGIGLAGDLSGTDNPGFVLAGADNWTMFDMSMSGDETVDLPDSAISSPEIKDEPGIATNLNSNIETLPYGGPMMDLLTVSMTTPAGGYVVVEGKCYVRLYGYAGENLGFIQIDTLSGGDAVYPWYQLAGSDGFPNTLGYYFPIYVTRTYYSDTATSYTFILEGEQFATDTLARASSWDHMLTATYYPSPYGSVVSAVASDQTSHFQSIVPIPQRQTKGITASASRQMYTVDLRELELKAANARAEAEKAQKELLQAKFKAQLEKNRTSISKPEQKQ